MPEWVAALAGSAAMLVTRGVAPADAGIVLRDNLPVYAFFLGMMTITTEAESAGVFEQMAEVAAQLARGSPRRLFLNVFLLGTVISTFLTNDATALILTPVIYALVTRLRLDALPFVFACTFIADTASMTLPVSNPINLILGQRFTGMGLGQFLRYLALPSLAAISLNVLFFAVIFRRALRGRFEAPQPTRHDKAEITTRRWALGCLLAIAVAFVAASAVTPGSVGVVALGGGGAMLAISAARGRLRWTNVRRGISWSIFPFVAGMFLMVRGIEHQGVTHQLALQVQRLAGTGTMRPALASTLVAAAGSNVINNVPMAAVMGATIPTIHGASAQALQFGTLIGCDLGPNLTVVGSLSTMIWLLLLRRRGINVSGLDYARLGVIVTPVMLIVSGTLLGLLLS
jgi:arsenical pump membrane protein